MPQQPKGKARNNHTTQSPLLLPFQWPGLSLWQVPPYFLPIISPPSAHPHGPACHCGRSRLATNTPNPLPSVKTTLERCGPFSLVVLSQRRSHVTSLSGHSDQNASETFSNKLQLNKVQSSLRQTSAKTTQVRSKAKTS